MDDHVYRYSLWLVPDGISGGTIRTLIDTLGTETGTEGFVPHMTLVAGVSASAATLPSLEADAAELARRLRPLSLTFTGYGYLNETHRSLFLRVDPSTVSEVFDIAAEIFPTVTNEHFAALPHVSVLYGEYDGALKQRLISEHPLPVTSAPVSALSLFRTEGGASHWHLHKSFPLR